MTPQQILDEVRNNFTTGQRRRFLPGLLIAFIRTLKELGAVNGRFANLDEFYQVYPRRTQTRAGGSANTWTVWRDANRQGPSDESLSIRPAYEAIQHWIRSEQRRFDYPSAAPHATQAWGDYQHWLHALLALKEQQLDQLEADTKAFVLSALPAYGADLSLVRREPPRFYLFMRDFDLAAHRGEPTGAAYQAAVFGYLRADAAHLQVDVAKVRTGSKRVGRIGDIDARDGELLVMAAEVKQFVIPMADAAGFAELADQVRRQGGLGLVVALEFEPGVREALKALGLEAVSRADLIERVRLWDALKQRVAVQALLYCVFYKEQNSALYERIKAFLAELEVAVETNEQPVEAEAASVDEAENIEDDPNKDAADRAADARDEEEAMRQRTSGDEGRHFDDQGV